MINQDLCDDTLLLYVFLNMRNKNIGELIIYYVILCYYYYDLWHYYLIILKKIVHETLSIFFCKRK